MSRGILVVLVVALFAVAGCGGSGTIKAAKNPQVQADIHQTEGIVKGCLAKSHLSAAVGARNALLHCIAPTGHTVALEACARKALLHDLPFHKSHLTPDVANCVVTNR